MAGWLAGWHKGPPGMRCRLPEATSPARGSEFLITPCRVSAVPRRIPLSWPCRTSWKKDEHGRECVPRTSIIMGGGIVSDRTRLNLRGKTTTGPCTFPLPFTTGYALVTSVRRKTEVKSDRPRGFASIEQFQGKGRNRIFNPARISNLRKNFNCAQG